MGLSAGSRPYPVVQRWTRSLVHGAGGFYGSRSKRCTVRQISPYISYSLAAWASMLAARATRSASPDIASLAEDARTQRTDDASAFAIDVR